MFALDTNAVIHLLRGKGQVAHRLLATPMQEVAIPAIVVYELESGLSRSRTPHKHREIFETLFRNVQELSFTAAVARTAASIRIELEQKGEGIGPFDNLIAGTAVHYGATLVTSNTREFSRVPGLRLVDWFPA